MLKLSHIAAGLLLIPMAVPAARADEPRSSANASASEDTTGLQEVIVTGIRKSLSDSINIKKSLDVVSDAVSAEDVGQFPDINLAESLQRITGIQITRLSADGLTANEGQYVSVRGLPTEFNYVSLNGEGAASASNNLIDNTSDRSFNFSVLPPDFISALEVYKSPRADFTEGGVAATINVETLTPLEVGKRLFKVSVEEQTSSQENTPKLNLAAIYSDVFADGVFGLTAGWAWNKRDYLNTAVTDAQLDPQTVAGHTDYVLDSNEVVETQNLLDTRTAYGALQFRPRPDLTFTVTLLHSTTQDDELQPAFTIRPQYASSYSSLVSDANGVLTTEIGNGSYYESQNFETWNHSRLDNLTFKQEWQTGNLSIKSAAAFSDSRTTSSQIGIDTLESGRFGIGPDYFGGYQVKGSDPIASFVLDPSFDTTDPNNYFFNYVGGNDLLRNDIIRSAHIDLTYSFPGEVIQSLSGGFRYGKEVNNNHSVFEEDLSQGHASVAPFVTSSPLGAPTLAGYNGSSSVPLDYIFINPQSYLGKYYQGSYANWLNSPTTQAQPNPTNQYTIDETSTAAYGMLNFKFDGPVPVHGNFGVRAVHTQQAVSNTAVNLSDITVLSPAPPPPAPAVIVPAGSQYTLSRSYNDILPSLNVSADLRSDVLLRLAVAKVMSRPTLDSLVPRYSVATVGGYSITGGNPNLDPFRAWQYDLSLEDYFRPDAIASIAGFYKKVTEFIQTQHQPLTLQGIAFDETIPVNTAGGYVWGIEANYTEQFTFLPFFLSGLGVQANATWAEGTEDADPAADLPAHEFQNLSRWTTNAALFYTALGVNGRLAYNYRSEYLSDPDLRGLGNTRVYGEPYSTVDFQVSYDITHTLSVFAEGTNLARKPQVFTMRVSTPNAAQLNYPQTWIEATRRVGAGFRLSF